MDERLFELNELLKVDNTNIELLEERGILYFELDDFHNCINDLVIVEENTNLNIDILEMLIISYLSIEKNTEAINLTLKHKLYGYTSSIYIDIFDKENAIKYIDLTDETNKYDLLKKAYTLSVLEDYEDATNVLNKILEIDDSYFDAYHDLICTYLQMHKDEEGKELSNYVVNKEFMNLKNYSELVIIWQNVNNDFALELTNIILEKEDHPWFMNFKGILLSELNRYDEAVTCFIYIIERDDEYDSAHANLGNLYFKQNKFEEGFDAFENAININPDNLNNYRIRGKHLLEIGKIDLALDDFNTLYSKSNDYNVLVEIAICYKSLSDIKAIDYINEAFAADNKSPYILNQKMLIECFFEKYNDASQTVGLLFDLMGDNDPYLYFHRANIKKMLEFRNQALNDYLKSFELDNNFDINVLRNIISILFDKEDYKQVIIYCDYCLELYPEDYICYYYKANSYKYLNKFDKALVNVDMFLKHEPYDEECLYLKGFCLYALDDLTNAIEIFTQLSKNENCSNSVYTIRGNCYLELKEYENALEDFNIAIKNDDTLTKVKLQILKCLSILECHESIIENSIKFMSNEKDKEIFIFMIADSYIKLNEYEKAIIELNKIIDENNIKKSYLEKRAYAYLDLEEFDKAIEDYTLLINNFDDIDLYYFRAVCYVDKADYNNALKDFNVALTGKFPDFVYYDIGNTYIHLSDYNKAIENFKKSFEIDPNQPECITNLAGCYYELKQYDKAIETASLITEEFGETYILDQLYIKIAIDKEEYNKALNLINIYLTKHENTVSIKYLLGKVYYLLNDEACVELLEYVINYVVTTKKVHRIISYNKDKEECMKMLKEFKK